MKSALQLSILCGFGVIVVAMALYYDSFPDNKQVAFQCGVVVAGTKVAPSPAGTLLP